MHPGEFRKKRDTSLKSGRLSSDTRKIPPYLSLFLINNNLTITVSN